MSIAAIGIGVSIGVWVGGAVRVSSISIVVRVSSVSIGRVEESWVSLGISLSLGLSLGNMDDSSRVGDISASTSVSSSNSGDGGISKTKGGQR